MIDTEKVILPTRITCVCVRAWVGVFVSKNVIFKFRKKQQQQQQQQNQQTPTYCGVYLTTYTCF